jgi:hypothetical protein
MSTFEETWSHRLPSGHTLMDLLGARLRRAFAAASAAPFDPPDAEAMIAAARCAFGRIEVRRGRSGIRYRAVPEWTEPPAAVSQQRPAEAR